MDITSIFAVIALLWSASAVNSAVHGISGLDQSSRNLTIVVLGRNDSGVSSTIQQLTKSKCMSSPINETLQNTGLRQYVISGIPSDHEAFNLQIVEVPGWIIGNSPKPDAHTLALLKAYVEAFGAPDFFVALSRYDDSGIDGINSLFVQTMRRLELFHDVFLNNTDFTNEQSKGNILVLLTHLMSAPRRNQRRPERRLGQFQEILEEFTNFRSPLRIVVGDNNAVTEHKVPVSNGYARLPNNELYPKNIWEALKSLTNDQQMLKMLDSIIANREVEFNCEVQSLNFHQARVEDDANAFKYLLGLKRWTVLDTEVNREIDQVYDNSTRETQLHDVVQKTALQLCLQGFNYIHVNSLATNASEKADFFQSNFDLLSAPTPAYYISRALNLEMPEYILPITIGRGYDVTKDELVLSPFKHLLTLSKTGYQLPHYMRCNKMETPETEAFKEYFLNISDYIEERLELLDFSQRDQVRANVSILNFMLKPGFNLKPEGSDLTLSTVREHRTIVCKLVEPTKWLLKNEFVDDVYSLNSFDAGDRDSVNEWQTFFSKWGTHIVSKSFGGGRIEGSMYIEDGNLFFSEDVVKKILSSIERLSPMPMENLGIPHYTFYGGKDASMNETMYLMEEKAREKLFSDWQTSLNSGFIMLMNEFDLVPISDLISEKIGFERAHVVSDALSLLLRGELIYNRRRPFALGHGQSDIIQQALQSHQEQMNLQIRNLEREIADRQHKSDADLAAAEAELERLKRERKQRTEQRQKEMRESLQRAAQNNREFYQRQTAQLEEEMKQAAEAERRQQEMLSRQQEESDLQHQRMMDQLAIQFAREEAIYREQARPQHVQPTRPSGHRVTDAPSVLTEKPTHFVSPSNQSVALGNGQSQIIQQAVQSHQEQMNLQIRNLEREIAARQHKSDTDLAAAEAALERLKLERKQRTEQRQKEMRESLQLAAQNNREFYQRQTAQLEEEMKQAAEAERRRQEMMERLAEQFAQEEEMYREQSRCSGVFSWIECQARGLEEKIGIVSATTSRPRNS